MYQKSWINLLTMAEAILASLIAIYLYVRVRKYFNRLDADGSLPIQRKEIRFWTVLFFTTMLFSVGNVNTAVLWMHIGNLVVLSFLAYTDLKTMLLDVPALGYLLIQNLSFYIINCLNGGVPELPDMGYLAAYMVTVLLCCLVKAFAIGDGCIYFAMLPVMLALQEDGGYPVLLLFFLIPLVLFLLIESGKSILEKRVHTLLSERKPFAPYLLAGYIISFLTYFVMKE